MSSYGGRAMNKNFAVLALLTASAAWGGAFVFTDDNPGNPNPPPNPNLIVHPINYTGAGGTITVQVCLATTSESQNELMIPVENTITTWNALNPVTSNLKSDNDNNIPPTEFDIESVILHETGHCLGLNHPNLANESGLADQNDWNYTKAQIGANDAFDLNADTDGVRGSGDDLRSDDINLHWFRKSNNNPFTISTVLDTSTYSRDLNDLPGTDTFAANADRTVATLALFNVPDTEAVMQQGTFNDEAQRELNHDDVATLRLGMAGLDETQGTGDDYQVNLTFGGVADGCDINIIMDPGFGGLANCVVDGQLFAGNPTHVRITSATINLASATSFDWFFNDVANGDVIFADGFE